MLTLPLVARSPTGSVRYILNASRRSGSAQVTGRAACFFPTSRSLPFYLQLFLLLPAFPLSPCSTHVFPLSLSLSPLAAAIDQTRISFLSIDYHAWEGTHALRRSALASIARGLEKKEGKRERKSLSQDNNTWATQLRTVVLGGIWIRDAFSGTT